MCTTASSVCINSHGEALMTSSVISAGAATGSHVLQINGFSLTKGYGNGKYFRSSTFSVGGHRWYMLFYPDGKGPESADWISLYVEHDRTDDVDVRARLKFSVLDGISESVSTFSRGPPSFDIFCSKNRSWGYPKFVERKELEESCYLKDDCLKVRCDLTVSNLKDLRAEATTQFVVVPPVNIQQQFGCLLSDAVGADVSFEVAGDVFGAHRCVLAARSSVFMAELFGPMKEKAMKPILIQDMEARVFKAMLHFIYTDNMPDIDKEDLFVITQHLLVAADRYDLQRLKLICEDKLCQCINTSTVATTLMLADQHGCHGLKKACFELLKSPNQLKIVMETEGFDHLLTTCPSLIKEVLAKVAICP